MDENELEDRGRQRWLIAWLGFFTLVAVLGGTFMLLQYNQGPLLADIVKITLGFLGGAGAGVAVSRRSRDG